MDNETVPGQGKACVCTLDSDIIILAVRFFETLGLSELRVGFCSRERYRHIPVHSLHSDPGRSKSLALIMLHSLNGMRHDFPVPEDVLWQEYRLYTL